MRTSFIAGNWKMNKTASEAKVLASELVDALRGSSKKIMIAPNFTCIAGVAGVVKGTNILLGAQNMAAAESGAHTGETSAAMLKDLGVDVVILGHSERRAIYGEDDALINTKVKLALEHGFEVILCVGETLEEREAGKADAIVTDQTTKGLAGVDADAMSRVTIAYEPVWAIGTGRTATPADADAVHKTIRKTLAQLYSKELAESCAIQYGGSVKPDNAADLLGMDDIDGALVGGASLKAETFVPIVEFDA